MTKCGKIFSTVILVIALAMAIAVNVMAPEKLGYLVPVSRFFEVMIPVLGVGALLKYLFSCSFHRYGEHEKECHEKICK